MVIISRIIDIMKEQENGCVTQRFCLAILQKCSIKDTVVPTMVQKGLIKWVMDLCKKSLKEKIHVFCLDFASAMLSNIIHTQSTLTYLEQNKDYTTDLMENLLRLMREDIPVSVLMHLLICLSYMSKENFQQQIDKCQFVERISDFVEYYS